MCRKTPRKKNAEEKICSLKSGTFTRNVAESWDQKQACFFTTNFLK